MHEVDHSQGRRRPRPLLLLDVDGVLNPFASPNCPPGYREHAFFPDDAPPVRLNESYAPWLPLLATRFDLAWATGWEDEANTKEAREWAASRTARTLLVTTDPAEGLTGEAVESLCGGERRRVREG